MKNNFLKLTVLFCMMLGFWIKGQTGTRNVERKGHSYYVDATLGNDLNDGLSKKSAWKTIARIQQTKLRPGDKVLLKRGEQFEGTLDLTLQGNSSRPIVIGAYGKDKKRPVVIAPDSSLFTIRILNSSYTTLRDLEIVNHGSTDLASRTGVKVEAKDFGVSKCIHLHNLFIHDVNGSIQKWVGGGSGILLENGGNKVVSTFDSLTIDYCHIQNCKRNGMIWNAYWERTNWHPNLNVRVRYNLIEEVPGDGIVPLGCDGAIVEYNVMRKSPDTMLRSNSEAAAGIWPWACDNTIIRYNESCDHKGPWDGQGFDADYDCTNTVIEYNYSHDNYGGMALMCTGASSTKDVGNQAPILRYNLSIGDGNRPYPTRGSWFSPIIHVAGPIQNGQIYRNIIHNRIKAAEKIDRSMLTATFWDGYAKNLLIKENIFYAPESSGIDLGGIEKCTMDNNYYLGKIAASPDEKGSKQLDEEHIEMVKDASEDGLLQLLDCVTIADGVQCRFVSKKKIEAFFNSIK